MSRQYNIRWKNSDNEELRRAVKNFNAKITRLAKKNPENKNLLPEKVSVRELRKLIETRQDFKREVNALKRFSRRGSEEIVNVPASKYNLKITRWQKNEMSRRVGIINRKRKKRLEELQETEMYSRGESLGYKKSDIGMGKADEVALRPMKAFTPSMNRNDLNYKFKNIMKESQDAYWDKRDLLLKENYISGLLENFNPNDIKDVIDVINNMDHREFRVIFDREGGNFEILYPPNKEQYNAYLSALKSAWLPNK